MRRFITTCVLAASAAVVMLANHPATFVMRNGDRVNGDLSYKGGTAYTLNGRDYQAQEVAVVAFVNDDPSAAELRQISRVDNNPNELDRHAFVTRDGRVMMGKLYKFSPDGETITFDARDGGRRDISANDLARIYINPGAARSVYSNILRSANQPVATTGVASNPAPAPPGSIAVNGNQPWTDTGINVKKGDLISFAATGQVRVASGDSPDVVADPNGANNFPAPRNNYPLPTMAVGGLIAKVGNDKAFGIGTLTHAISMPDNGRLYLGVNDDGFGDNSGAFYVRITRTGR
jgi:PA-IL-like protein